MWILLALSLIDSASAFVVPGLRVRAPQRSAVHARLDASNLPEDFDDFDMGLLKCVPCSLPLALVTA